MKWTSAQARAIYARGENLLVNAAAGSGKTAVLTERILALVREGASLGGFLVVTFTESATIEMKQRISKRLMQAAHEESDAKISARLQKEARDCDQANISTLHAFCLYILKRHFHILGLDPAFSPADQVLSELLLKEAHEKAAEEAYAKKDADFLALLSACHYNHDALLSYAQDLRNFLMARPDPWIWLEQAIDMYAMPAEEIKAHILTERLFAHKRDTHMQVQKLMKARESAQAYTNVCAVLDADAAMLRALLLARDAAQYGAMLAQMKFSRLSFPKGAEEDVKKSVVKARDAVKKAMREQSGELQISAQDECTRMCEMRPALLGLGAFIKRVDELYAMRKRERNKIDFSDMEHMALFALRDASVQNALRDKFEYIFVDEYQDSNMLQEALIDSVRRENNLFLVGDVKQSIYRFRQADPGLFLHKMALYNEDGGAPGRQIFLNTNFRSGKAVIDAVNAVFERIMSEEAAEIEYDANAALYLPEGEKGEHTALSGAELFIISDSDLESELGSGLEGGLEEALEGELESEAEEEGIACEAEEEERPDVIRGEAIFAANKIRELMKSTSVLCDGKPRPLRYSDFAILLRSHRQAGEIWAQTLSAMGVPAYVQLTGGYFDAIEVQLFLNLLRVIDNLRQDIPLVSVLRSPIFAWDEEALVSLKLSHKADTMYESFLLAASADTELGERTRNICERIAHWRRFSRLLPLGEYIAFLLHESGLYDCMGVLNGGKERQANLDALLYRAREYENAGGESDIWSFVQYMDGAKSTASMGSASKSAADVVRILSMHKSKGLEFPVVFLASLNKGMNKQDLRKPLVYDAELGIGAKLAIKGIKKDTLLRRAILARMRDKSIAEEMRILYVGMTRAKERLIMIGSRADAKDYMRICRFEPITPAYCLGARSYLDWLLPAALQSGKISVSLAPLSANADMQNCVKSQEAEAYEYAQVEKLRADLEWLYAYASAVQAPSKVSVSELLNAKTFRLREPPTFLPEKRRVSGAELGSAVHTFLREMELNANEDVEGFIEAELMRMARVSMLGKNIAAALPKRDIEWFLRSPLYARLLASKRVHREIEFSCELKASELLNAKSDEPVLLQGVIDCCFLEDDAWVLIDYKTDSAAHSDTNEKAADAHSEQLRLYALALSRLTGIPVSEKLVVLLRARAVEKVI